MMLSKVPLRRLLIIPFVLQVVGAVGIIGWLSFRSGQKSTNQIAYQLREEITKNTKHQITDILATATTISKLTTASIRANQIDLQNIRSLEELYWTDLTTFSLVRGLGVGNASGDLMGMFKQVENGESTYHLEYIADEDSYVSLKLNSERQIIETSTMSRQVDARERPWYQAASKAGESVWTEPYASIGRSTSQTLLINYSTPVFDKNRVLQGVTSIILDLSQLSEILSNLDLGPSGHVFVLQPTGELIGTSDGKPPLKFQNEIVEQLRATESTTPLIQASAAYLNQEFNNRLDDIHQEQQFEFFIEGKRQFLKVAPLSTTDGLHWLVVVAMPEADFMDQIYANTRTTLIICLGTLAIAITLGIFTARWIVNPIKHLSQATTHLSEGEFDQPLNDNYPIKEVSLLAQSFIQMAQNLRNAFTALQDSNSLLRMTLQSAQMICWDYSLETQQVLCFGQYTEEGWEAISWQTSSDEFFLSYSHKQLQQTIQKAIQDGGQIKFEHRLARPNRPPFWALASGQVAADKSGNPARIMGISLNISDRKEAEQQIQYQQELLHTVIDAVPNLIFVKDWDGRYLLTNKAAANFYGTTVEDVFRKTDADFHPYPEEVERFIQENRAVIESGKPLFIPEERVSIGDGTGEWLQWQKQPLQIPGVDTPCVLGVGVKITARKQAEIALQQQAQREQALNQVVQTIRSSLELETIFSTATQVVAHLLGLDKVAIVQYQPGQRLWVNIDEHRTDPSLPDTLGLEIPDVGNPFAEQLKRLEIVEVNNTDTIEDPINQSIAQIMPGSWLLLPLDTNGNLWGTLAFLKTRPSLPYPAADVELAQRIADQLAIAIQQAELYQQVQQEREKLRDAIEFAPFPIMIHAENGEVLQINTVWTELTGYTHQDIPTIRDWARHAYGEQAANVVENVILKKYELTNRWDEGEFTITTLNGRQRIWQFSSAPLGRLRDGRRTVISMAVDVTQRRQAELDLRTSEQRYATLASAVPVGIFRTNAAGDCIYANERCLQLIDSSLEDALGQGWIQRIYLHDRGRVMGEWSQFIQGNQRFQLEYRFQQSDGQVIWVYGQAIAEQDIDGQVAGYVGTITDISDRKLIEVEREALLNQFAQLNLDLEQANQQLEDYSHTLEQKVAARTAQLEVAQEQIIAQEKLASLGTLTAGIAHELSNPLNFVKNFAEGSVELSQELLETLQPLISSLEPETSDFAQTLITDLQENGSTIRHHSLRAEQIIESMMQHTHADYEQEPTEAVHIDQLLNRAVKLASHSKQSQSDHFHLSIQTDYGVNLPPINVIPSSLIRAFINLIDNACDAMYVKHSQLQSDSQSVYTPTLSISANPTSQGIEIHIRDNGCGIAPSIKDKIMDPFFTTKEPGQGTGLGLSITHDIIVKQHQGALAIHTESGKFTDFVLTLPLK